MAAFLTFKNENILYTFCRQLLEAFIRCKELGALAQVHAENGDVIAKVGDLCLLLLL